jgi:type II secretory ATPase GspE/PulE/Tfp pilus assembly ATPase PilB-like protein
MSIVSRLMEMGVPQSIITASLIGIVSSRLVRSICPHCKKEYSLNEIERSYFNEFPKDVIFYKGMGCDKCRNTGYLGRTGIFNIVTFDDEVKLFVTEKHTDRELLDLYARKNIKTLEESAMSKVLQGSTTIDEVARVIGASASTKKVDSKTLMF